MCCASFSDCEVRDAPTLSLETDERTNATKRHDAAMLRFVLPRATDLGAYQISPLFHSFTRTMRR